MLTAADPRTISRYLVEDRLGRGGMGTVYLARDPQLGRQVALKLVQAEFDSAEGRSRFEKEARSIAALNHPNIVTVYDLGEFESRPFIVLEYIEGYSLDAVIRERRPIPMDVRLRWLEELGAGLQFAHDRGIIHRDVKPANLMVDHLDRLRILDFGIARIAGTASTHLSSVIGTPGYMAPEYVLDQQFDQRVDIFAAGAVAYELLTYTPAFPGRTHATIIQKILECSPRRMSEASAFVDAEVEAVIMRALHRDPGERYQSAEAFAAAVRELRLQRDWSTWSPAAASEQTSTDDVALETPAATVVVPASAPDPTRHFSPATVVVPGVRAAAPEAESFAAQDVFIPTPVVARGAAALDRGRNADGEPSTTARYAIAAALVVLIGGIAIAGTWLWSSADDPPPATAGNTGVTSGSPATGGGSGGGGETPAGSGYTPPGGGYAPPVEPSDGGTKVRTVGDAGSLTASAPNTVPAPRGNGGAPIPTPTAGRARGPDTTTDPDPVPAATSAAALFFQPRANAGDTPGGSAPPWLAGLRYQVLQRVGESTERHADADTVFRSGDEVRFAFESNADGYLYVVQQGTSGNWTVLFPHPDVNGGRNKVTAFQRQLIPSDFWFEFDERPGSERIFVLFSKTPYATLPGFDRPVTSVETIPDASVKAAASTIQTRDLIVEKAPASGGTRAGTYIVNRDELATAVSVSFTLVHK